MKRHAHLILLFIFSLLSAQAATGEQRSGPNPKSDAAMVRLLKEQLKHEKNCDLSEILTYNEMRIGDDKGISGKILCIGGQQYEYTRLRKHLKFEFRICEPSVC